MPITSSQIMTILGTRLEVQTIQPEVPQPGPTLVFLHEGLGCVALWRDWPAQLCARLACAGLVYSRQGYGQSDATPDVRGPSRTQNGQRHGRLLPDYMHREALEVLPALLSARCWSAIRTAAPSPSSTPANTRWPVASSWRRM